MNLGQWGHLEKVRDSKTGQATYERTAAFGGSHARFWDPNSHIPCQNPPFGELVAVNANTGDIAWKVPLGTVEELEAKGIKNTGALNLGGGISTASGLIFIGATNDSRFRAFDSRTGRELWTAKMDASAYSVPITYQGRDGKQYVVVVAGGGSFWASPTADSIIAYALP
jgi:quinoprotein glucose dehydrogenase